MLFVTQFQLFLMIKNAAFIYHIGMGASGYLMKNRLYKASQVVGHPHLVYLSIVHCNAVKKIFLDLLKPFLALETSLLGGHTSQTF